jgi:uncharacterized membrane protein YphA (DoxX/SURF4 family)
MSGEPASLSGPISDDAHAHWNPLTRIAFRLAFCYFGLHCLSMLDELHVVFIYMMARRAPANAPDPYMAPLWHRLVPWVGQHILHLAKPITVFSNGSGDTTYDWVLLLCFLAASALATFLWSFLDRRRANYRTLHQWLRLLIVLSLGAVLLSYGWDKAIPLQFGSLGFSRLSEPLGEMSPAMLLWNFMAASRPYTIAAGLVEVLGGVLLFVPRLTTLGALVSIGAMANVFGLNMSYDVPVKLLSFHMGLLAAFLLLPEVPRLLNVFVLNRPAAPLAAVPLSSRSWLCRAALLLRLSVGALLCCMLFYFSHRTYAQQLQQARAASAFPLYGVWSVDEFTVSGNSATSLFTPKLLQSLKIPAWKDRWERLVFHSPDSAAIQLSTGALNHVTPKLDLKSNSLVLTDSEDKDWQCTLTVQTPGARLLRLQGTVNGLTVNAQLHREDEDRFLLTHRGFHWINEYPDFR